MTDFDAGSTNAGADDWRSSLPEDLRAHPALGNLPDVAALAREHVNAQGLIGRKGIIPPGDKDGPEAWERFHAALGRPSRPDDYAFAVPDGVEGYDADFAGWFRQAAHKAGLPARQATALHDAYVEMARGRVSETAAAREARIEEAEAELRRDWGRGYDRNLGLARRAAGAFADPEIVRDLADRYGDAALVRLFARVGEAMSEDRLAGTGSGPGGGGFGLDAGAARAEIARVQGDAFRNPQHPLMDATHPEHDGLVERLRQLYRVAHSG